MSCAMGRGRLWFATRFADGATKRLLSQGGRVAVLSKRGVKERDHPALVLFRLGPVGLQVIGAGL
jgi:hypothetical protein